MYKYLLIIVIGIIMPELNVLPVNAIYKILNLKYELHTLLTQVHQMMTFQSTLTYTLMKVR